MCAQNVSLNSSLDGQGNVHRGENVTFQCSTVGSSILAWSSDEYISDRIEFLAIHRIGTIVAPNHYTSAVLIDIMINDGGGQVVIVSQLSIVVQKDISQSSITCHNVGRGQTKTVSFQLSSKFLCWEVVT